MSVKNSSVSIIIPAYKEEKSIKDTISGIIESFKKNISDFEIITVIDTVPNDKTYEIIQELANNYDKIQIIKREGKQGIASAISDGIKKASKENIMIAMADQSENAQDLVKMTLKMNDGYDMVFGSRFLEGATMKNYPLKKLIASRLCNKTIQILFGIKSKDITNAAKIYKAEILKNMNISSVGFEVFVEIPLKAYTSGYKNLSEIPLSHHVRKDSETKLNLWNEWSGYFKMIMKCWLSKNNKK